METDAIDDRILNLLMDDGRLSNREVARRLDISEGTVRQRLKKLEDAKAIRIGAVVDPRRMGLEVTAMVLVSVEPSRLEGALDTFSRLSEVHYVASIMGQFNVLVLVTAESLQTLRLLINAQIERFTGVHRVDVRLVVGTRKHEYHIISIPQ
jgi:Lrp/AsnC family transcriptional regulator, regulator for asnA, asnC and gidA